MRVRLASYNVQGFRAGLDAVLRVIEPFRPDLVLLQECGSRRAVRRFATALEMDVTGSHRFLHRVRNAVLFRSPWRLIDVEVGDLSREGGTMERGFVVAHVRRAGVRVSAVSAHLGLSSRERERHARELTDALAGSQGQGALVVGADLNEGPDGPAARWIAGRLYDAFLAAPEGPGETFPAAAPTARIDFLFVNERVQVDRAWVIGSALARMASDHRPVLADVEILS